MKVIDLTPEYEAAYFNCLEEWSDEMKEAGEHKACWYRNFNERGLRVKIALDEDDAAIGMIQYLPIEESIVEGKGLYFIPCIWVHGHKKGVGNRQGKGAGTALLEAAEQDAKAKGATGMAAWGLWIPVWMKASWYRKHGYKKADRDGISLLVWKSFSNEATRPHWIRPKKQVPRVPGKVAVTAFTNGWCQVQNIVHERVKRVAEELGDVVSFTSIETSDRDVFDEWGISDGIYIDGKKLNFGPPISNDKIKAILGKKVDKL